MKQRRWIALLIAIVLIFMSIGARFTFSLASGLLVDIFDTESIFIEETTIREGNFTEKIAVIKLDGAIIDLGTSSFLEGYNHHSFVSLIETAFADETVDAIILQVDSPGGGVYETEDIYRKILEGQEEYDKPFYVSMGSMAASGGYYVAAPADKIYAQPTTLTGSIGVIMENINYSGLAEKYGVTFNTIKSGKHKDIMSPSREMTDEERDILQSMIDEMYDEFVRVIVDGRNLDEKTVRKIGDGRIYTGKQAKEVNLVDEIGNLDDTIDGLMKDHNLEGATVVEYGSDTGLFSLFALKAQNLVKSQSELEMINKLLIESDQPRAMYIY